MSDLVAIVDALEVKISKLLHKLEQVEQSRDQLKASLDKLKSDYKVADESIADWEEKYKALKLANSMLGSESNKKEAKLKINALIRELDHCIVQLAE
jgi:chromosome segregation ATPase